jgi:hypothetical protein
MTGQAFALPPIEEVVERLAAGPGNKLDELVSLMTSPEGKAWQKAIAVRDEFRKVAALGSESYRDSIMATIHAIVAGYAAGVAVTEAKYAKAA